MIAKIVIVISLVFCISGRCLAQTPDNENLQWQDVETFLDQGALSSGDIISVVIKRVSDLSGEYTIDPTGRVDLPLIGKVDTFGQTLTSFAEMLEGLYEADYLVDPEISITMFAERLPEKEIVTYIETSIDPQPINNAASTSIDDNIFVETGPNLESQPLSAISNSNSNSNSNINLSPTPIITSLPEASIEPIPEIEPRFSSEIYSTGEPNFNAETVTPQMPERLITNPIPIDNFETGRLDNDIDFEESTFSASQLEGTQWVVKSEQQEFIQFLTGGDIAGAVGCNSFFAQYKEEGANMNISFVASTFVECEDNSKPQEFIDVLKLTRSYSVTREDLKLRDESNYVILSLSRALF